MGLTILGPAGSCSKCLRLLVGEDLKNAHMDEPSDEPYIAGQGMSFKLTCAECLKEND